MAQLAQVPFALKQDQASLRQRLIQIGGVSAWAQLGWLVVVIIVGLTLGPWPETVEGYFSMYAETPLLGLLRDDVTSLVLILLYIGLMPGIALALWQENPLIILFTTLFTGIAVITSLATQSSFALLHLAERYELAATAAEQARLLAAGEAVLASNMWNSTSGFFNGILLQGSGVLLSYLMLRSKKFGTLTGAAGLIANGFDLLQHLLHLFAPAAAGIIITVAGPFYLLWYLLMGRDLLRHARKMDQEPQHA
ncbi:MAG: hypothetical protein GYB68_12125 [Chloroflexi bacterium]|nr:hypothetical protein [Chloroflexota bacterium]